MATLESIDIESLMAPISTGGPSGPSLLYAPGYDAVRQARRREDDTGPRGDWGRKAKEADWDRVVRLGSDLLGRETKDLQLAAWVAEALVRRDGFAGLHVGLRLVREIQDRFWESYHPAIEDGDPESRHGPFDFLDATLPTLIRSLPLTAGAGTEPYSFLKWRESRETDNVGRKSPSRMEELVAEGKITSKEFDDRATQTPSVFYESLREDLALGLEALEELDRSNRAHFGDHAPGLGGVREAIKDCLATVDPILDAQRPEEDEDDECRDEVEPVEMAERVERVERVERSQAVPPRAVGPIADAADACRRIAEAAAYLRREDPRSPVPYLVVRSLRAGRLYGLSDLTGVSLADSPSSETRQALRRLAAEGDWPALLEQAEEALARPEGLAWLDAHREALRAMAGLGDELAPARAACRGFLRMLLADFPEWGSAELGDGTSAAGADTRAWLSAEFLTEIPEKSPASESTEIFETVTMPDRTSRDGTDTDPWDGARAAIRERRAEDALAIIRRALDEAVTGRDRFVRTLQLAEVCDALDRPGVALPLAEALARQVDAYHLERWEGREICARVWALLHRCLHARGGGSHAPERSRRVFARLCRVDAGRALACEAVG